MPVTLKQRTFRTADGRPVPEGHPDAAFLVGAEGRQVTDETAARLGLIDGRIPDANDPADVKERREREDKERRYREDKAGGRRPPKQDRPVTPPQTEDQRYQRLAGVIAEMEAEADQWGENRRKQLFTAQGKPDSRVLSGRINGDVSAQERDAVWDRLQQERAGNAVPAAPDAHEPLEADADIDDDSDAPQPAESEPDNALF